MIRSRDEFTAEVWRRCAEAERRKAKRRRVVLALVPTAAAAAICAAALTGFLSPARTGEAPTAGETICGAAVSEAVRITVDGALARVYESPDTISSLMPLITELAEAGGGEGGTVITALFADGNAVSVKTDGGELYELIAGLPSD